MAKKRKPDHDYDGHGHIKRTVRDALKAVFDPEDRNSVDVDILAAEIADAVHFDTEQMIFNAIWKHEHKERGKE